MPPKRKPGVTRGIKCPRCGHDEWVKRTDRPGHRCGHCWRKQKLAHVTKKLKDQLAWRLWRKAKVRAKRAGIPFNVTVEDIKRVWPKDGRCPALGVRMQEGRPIRLGLSPSLDRLVPQWGYTRDNIAVISTRANMLKNNGSAAELELIAAWMKSNGLS